MKMPKLLVPAAFAALLCLGVACGDGPAKPVGEGTPAASGSPTRPPIPADFGPAPTLGGNVKTITPAHAAQVKQASTRSPSAQVPHGLCAEVTFDGLPENAQWFRVAFDDKEVTEKLTWIVATQTDPKDGKVCYAPTEGFAAGKHSAALSVQDPRNPASKPKQVVGWAFEVIP